MITTSYSSSDQTPPENPPISRRAKSPVIKTRLVFFEHQSWQHQLGVPAGKKRVLDIINFEMEFHQQSVTVLAPGLGYSVLWLGHQVVISGVQVSPPS